MPMPAGAVFLSYASQDAEAARRICNALRAAGIEVWFDQDELRGGDQWDAKIKRQIRECALFVPIISRTTQARTEGYFRREWNLATQRLLDMAPGRPFLLPIVIDDTSEREANVQEEFLQVQWTRVPGGELSAAGVERTRTLLEALAQRTRDPLPRPVPPSAVPQPTSRRRLMWWLGVCALIAAVAGVVVFQSRTSSSRLRQLAILPFKAIGESPGHQAFCDGLSETITSQLTQLEQFQRTLLVVPLAEVRKEAITTPSQARALFGATVVLAGSVQRADASVRVTINLIDAVTLRIIRSETFDQLPNELYRLQDRVAAQTASWLGLKLSDQAKQALAAGQTTVASAYELYVQGRGELVRRDVRHNLDAAIVQLQQAVMADPGYALAHAALGEAFWQKYVQTEERRWIDEARRSCRLALQHGASLASPHVTLAILLHGTGEYEQAVAEAQTALRMDPTSVDATRVLARVYDSLNRPAEAEAAFLSAIERSPENVLPLTDLAVFYWRVGRMDEAEKYFLRVTELTPQNHLAFRNLGGLYVQKGKPELAVVNLEKSLALKATAAAYSNLGSLRFQQGKYAEAATLFERATQLRPNDHMMIGNWADALRLAPGRAADAVDAYRAAIRYADQKLVVNPKDAAVRARLARFLAFAGDTARAHSEIEEALRLAPKVVPVLFNAAIVYEQTGQRAKALEAVGRALQAGASRVGVENQPDLNGLRDDPRYVSLLAEAGKVNPQPK